MSYRHKYAGTRQLEYLAHKWCYGWRAGVQVRRRRRRGYVAVMGLHPRHPMHSATFRSADCFSLHCMHVRDTRLSAVLYCSRLVDFGRIETLGWEPRSLGERQVFLAVKLVDQISKRWREDGSDQVGNYHLKSGFPPMIKAELLALYQLDDV